MLEPLTPLTASEPSLQPASAMPTHGTWRAEGAIALIGGLATLFLLVATAGYAYLFFPYSDAHDWAASVLRTERTHAWLTYLWEPHAAQRIPLARLAEAAEIEAGGGRRPMFLWLAATLWSLGAACLAARLAYAPVLRRTKVWLAMIATLILADVALAEDFAFPVFAVYLFVAGPALAAICLFAGAGPEGSRVPSFWGALLCAILASGGNAAGLAIWPVLLMGAALQARSRAQIAIIGGFAAVVFALVEGGLGLPSSSLGAGGGGLAHLAKMVVYFLCYCGLPWSRGVHGTAMGALIGAPILVGAGAVIATGWRSRGPSWPILQRAGLMLVAFGLFTAALATVGRVDELPTPIVPTRYTPFAALLQLGVALGLSGPLDRALHRRARRLSVTAACVLLLLAGVELRGARGVRKTSDHIRRASAVFDRGGAPRDVTIHPRPDFARVVRAELRRRGLPS